METQEAVAVAVVFVVVVEVTEVVEEVEVGSIENLKVHRRVLLVCLSLSLS